MAELMCSSSLWMSGCQSMASRAALNPTHSLVSNPLSTSPLLEIKFPSFAKHPSGSGIAPIRMMGGGPRTFPGGVTKWQWKRMQERKTKQIEKARLLRERQLYEARRRAELLAANPEVEKPWEKISRFRPANYVTADEQIKELAGRFRKEGAEDLWTDNDGPQMFETPDGQPSARFFPPNAVYSTRMYKKVDSFAANDSGDGTDSQGVNLDSWPSSRSDGSSRIDVGSFKSESTLTKDHRRGDRTERHWTNPGEDSYASPSRSEGSSRRESKPFRSGSTSMKYNKRREGTDSQSGEDCSRPWLSRSEGYSRSDFRSASISTKDDGRDGHLNSSQRNPRGLSKARGGQGTDRKGLGTDFREDANFH